MSIGWYVMEREVKKKKKKNTWRGSLPEVDECLTYIITKRMRKGRVEISFNESTRGNQFSPEGEVIRVRGEGRNGRGER